MFYKWESVKAAKERRFLKRIGRRFLAMALSMMRVTAWSPFLSAVSNDASSCDEVVTVISVENGEPSVYTGEEAKQFLLEQRLRMWK